MSESPENRVDLKTPRINQRWLTVGFAFLGLVNAFGLRVCLSIAITQMTIPRNNTVKINLDDTCPDNNVHVNITHTAPAIHSNAQKFDWNEETQGIILSSFYWGYIMTSLVGGAICRKLGGKHALGFGILITSVFTILIPYCVNWGGTTALIILRVATGFGEGTTYPALAHLLAYWIPDDERSKAGGIVFSGAPLGTIFGMVFSGIILQYSDWPMVFYFYGGCGVMSFLLIAAFCYSKPSENPYISQHELAYLEHKMKNSHADVPSTPWKYIAKTPAAWASIAVKFGGAWILLTVVSDMPKYMSSVLKFSALHNGFLSSIPHLSTWIGGIVGSFVANKLIAEKIMSITVLRKIGCSIALLGPAIFLIAASYAGCDGTVVISLQAAGMFFNGCTCFSIVINAIDLSPNYASAIMGIGNGIGVISGILAPYIAGVLTPNQTMSEWQLVFWIVFVVAVISNTIYVFYGSGKVQEWNDPAFLNNKKMAKTNDGKDGVYQLLPLNKK